MLLNNIPEIPVGDPDALFCRTGSKNQQHRENKITPLAFFHHPENYVITVKLFTTREEPSQINEKCRLNQKKLITFE